jgi:prophage regulatory protein
LTNVQAAAQAAAPADPLAAWTAALSPAWEAAPDFLDGRLLEGLTGTKAANWRYWDFLDRHAAPGAPRHCPPSFKIGRRRVWRKDTVIAWLAEQEKASSAGAA